MQDKTRGAAAGGIDETLVDASRWSPNDSTWRDTGEKSGGIHESQPQLLDAEQFAANAIEMGLITADDVETVVDNVGKDAIEGDASLLANELVRRQNLTQYQAEVLIRGQTRGLVLGNYVIREKLGEGGMGMVFKAHHRRMKREVALKVLPPGLTNSPDAIARFHREVEAAAKLTHPNIAAAYDADESDGLHFLVMEYIDGPSLSAYVKESGVVNVGAAVNLILQAARGLAHAHARGVVHRDIKPGNLLVNREGTLKVLDMGLAQLQVEAGARQEMTELTQSGRVMGTVDYMAPEQALDAKRVDHRADIYSLGCTLFFLVTGRAMSPDGTLTQKLLWHQNEAVPSLTEVCDGATQELDEVFQRMVAKTPEERHSSVRELIEELEAVLPDLPTENLELADVGIVLDSGSPSTSRGVRAAPATIVERPTATDLGAAPTPIKPAVSAAQETEKKRWPLVAAAVVVLALIAGGVAAMLGGGGEPSAKSAANKTAGKGTPGGAGPTDPPKAGGKTNPQNGKQGGKATPNSNKTGAKTVPPVKREPERVLYQDVLAWAFDNKGVVSLKPAGGSTVEVRSLDEVRRLKKSYQVEGINLNGSPVQDDELKRLGELAAADKAPPGLAISLANTDISDEGLAHLKPLQKLRRLDLSGAEITGEGLVHLKGHFFLELLNLNNTGVTSGSLPALADLGQLRTLLLSDTAVDDTAVVHLARLDSLRDIYLNNTDVTQAGHDALKDKLPKLEKVLWDSDRDREVANHLLRKGAKLTIKMRRDDKTKEVSAINDLPGRRFLLTRVNVSRNARISDQDLQQLQQLEHLEGLDLSGTRVTEQGLGYLHDVKSLKHLKIAAYLKDASVKALKEKLPDLEVARDPGRDLEATQWVLSTGGRVTILPEGGRRVALAAGDKPPQSFFTVRSVDLTQATKVTGADLAQLQNLAYLESLHLRGEQFDDAAMKHLTGCSALSELTLSQTKVSKTGLATVAKAAPGLRKLDLTGTPIDGEALATLGQTLAQGASKAGEQNRLAHLVLAGTNVGDEDLVYLKRFPQLSYLDLSGTPVTDASVETLVKLKRSGQAKDLASVVVQETKITDAGLESLVKQLGAANVKGDPLDRQRLAARQILAWKGRLKFKSGLEIDGQQGDSQLPKDECVITEINLTDAVKVDPERLADLLADTPNLTKLVLYSTWPPTSPPARHWAKGVRDSHLQRLAGLKELSHLYLGGATVTDSLMPQVAACDSLQVLDLRSTRVTGAGLKTLAGLPHLSQLYVPGLYLTDADLPKIAEVKNLTVLDLSGNRQITASGVAKLAPLTNLTYLWLSGTNVDDSVFDTLASMKQLKVVNLSGAKITDSGIGKLAELKKLERVDLSGADLTKETVDELKKTLGAKVSVVGVFPTRQERDRRRGQPGAFPTDSGGGRLFPGGAR